jgi:hypothetical protein
MTRLNKILTLLVFLTTTVGVSAQNGTNSPYSRFGFGTLSDQSQGMNKAMGGVALGLREGKQVNMQNPASYSSLDSLNMVVDLGLTFQNGNFSYNGIKKNARNASFDYACLGFRVWRRVGMSIGFLPFTKVGYDFSNTKTVGKDDYTGNKQTVETDYTGTGGLHEVYYGVGWNPFGGLSVGANIMYLWGDYSNDVTQTYYDNGTASSDISKLNRYYTANIESYRANFGLQYVLKLNKTNQLTLGATFELGHKVNNNAHYTNYLSSSDSLVQTAKKAFDIPYAYGVGLAWNHDNRLTVAADYTMQKWSDCRFPHLAEESNGQSAFSATKGVFSDMHKISAGAEYIPNRMGRRYFDHVYYRIGGYYSTPYVKINGEDGPKEFAVGAGLGLPILNNINNRSILNLGFQWVRRTAASSMPKENYLRLTIGITFNEMWFNKFKID